ncbi:MAG: hypothetical protein WCV81_02410 [Microgenomates group bacterium]|jgi:hypothetical protein
MPSSSERRLINWFARSIYNTQNAPKIVEVKADREQEAPDSICKLDDGSVIALELTSFGPPKGTTDRNTPSCTKDFAPLIKTLGKKLHNDYRIPEADEVWLLVHLRYTMEKELVKAVLKDLEIPPRFNKIFVEWPLPQKTERMSVNVLELPSCDLWVPDLPRPNRFVNRLHLLDTETSIKDHRLINE